jgi:septal ring factor EnvC (AmiA/AmiB activator)
MTNEHPLESPLVQAAIKAAEREARLDVEMRYLHETVETRLSNFAKTLDDIRAIAIDGRDVAIEARNESRKTNGTVAEVVSRLGVSESLQSDMQKDLDATSVGLQTQTQSVVGLRNLMTANVDILKDSITELRKQFDQERHDEVVRRGVWKKQYTYILGGAGAAGAIAGAVGGLWALVERLT